MEIDNLLIAQMITNPRSFKFTEEQATEIENAPACLALELVKKFGVSNGFIKAQNEKENTT